MDWQTRYILVDAEYGLQITVACGDEWEGWGFYGLNLRTGYAFMPNIGYSSSDYAKEAAEKWLKANRRYLKPFAPRPADDESEAT